MDSPLRFRFDRFELDPASFKLLKDGVPVALEPKALDVLYLLVLRAPRVVEKGELFSAVWKDVAVTDNALTRVVTQLRRALEDDPRAPRYIETVATRGYRWVAGTEVVRSPEPERHRPPAHRPDWFPLRAIVSTCAAMLLAGATWAGIRLARSDDASKSSSGEPDVAAFAALAPRQLTAGRGFDGFVAFAPDGRSVAFSSDRSGALEIYVQGTAPGSTPTALTGNGRHNVQPAWSPDGALIAYHEMAGNGIWVVPSRGGVARQVSDFGAHPAWSPDGRFVAFQSLPLNDVNPLRLPGALSTIWIVDVFGRGEPVPLTEPGDPPGPHLAPAWWEDSRSLLFSVPGGSKAARTTAVWSVDIETRTRREIAAHERLTPDFAIAPNRRGVYFVARGVNAIWWLPLSENGASAGEPGPTGLPTAGSMLADLALSGDGLRMGWTTVDASSHLWATARVGSAGGGPLPAAPLTDGMGAHYGFAAPAADGRVALVGSTHGNGASVFLLSRDAALRRVTTDAAGHTGAQWLPGDREIALVADHGEGPAFWAVDPDTGRERLLFTLAELPRPPGPSQPSTASPAANIAIARDFTRVAMAIVRDGRPNIWIAGLSRDTLRPDGTIVQRTFEREGGSYPAWSPDGRWIAYQCADGTNTHVCVIGEDGRGRSRLTSQPGQSWIGGWAPDNDTVVYAARRSGVWNVATVSRATSINRTLTGFTGPRSYVRYPRWDAFRDRVVFDRAETAGRVWAVDIPRPRPEQPVRTARGLKR